MGADVRALPRRTLRGVISLTPDKKVIRQKMGGKKKQEVKQSTKKKWKKLTVIAIMYVARESCIFPAVLRTRALEEYRD